jgi:cytochrome c oxidase assembly protein subunit 15
MDGDFIPRGLWDLSPTFINIFENIITVQFDHRILAIIVVISVAIFYWRTQRVRLTVSQRLSTHALLAAACFQVALGISTLLLVVPIPLAAMHQLGGVILLTTTIWLAHEFRSVQTI